MPNSSASLRRNTNMQLPDTKSQAWDILTQDITRKEMRLSVTWDGNGLWFSECLEDDSFFIPDPLMGTSNRNKCHFSDSKSDRVCNPSTTILEVMLDQIKINRDDLHRHTNMTERQALFTAFTIDCVLRSSAAYLGSRQQTLSCRYNLPSFPGIKDWKDRLAKLFTLASCILSHHLWQNAVNPCEYPRTLARPFTVGTNGGPIHTWRRSSCLRASAAWPNQQDPEQ